MEIDLEKEKVSPEQEYIQQILLKFYPSGRRPTSPPIDFFSFYFELLEKQALT